MELFNKIFGRKKGKELEPGIKDGIGELL